MANYEEHTSWIEQSVVLNPSVSDETAKYSIYAIYREEDNNGVPSSQLQYGVSYKILVIVQSSTLPNTPDIYQTTAYPDNLHPYSASCSLDAPTSITYTETIDVNNTDEVSLQFIPEVGIHATWEVYTELNTPIHTHKQLVHISKKGCDTNDEEVYEHFTQIAKNAYYIAPRKIKFTQAIDGVLKVTYTVSARVGTVRLQNPYKDYDFSICDAIPPKRRAIPVQFYFSVKNPKTEYMEESESSTSLILSFDDQSKIVAPSPTIYVASVDSSGNLVEGLADNLYTQMVLVSSSTSTVSIEHTIFPNGDTFLINIPTCYKSSLQITDKNSYLHAQLSGKSETHTGVYSFKFTGDDITLPLQVSEIKTDITGIAQNTLYIIREGNKFILTDNTAGEVACASLSLHSNGYILTATMLKELSKKDIFLLHEMPFQIYWTATFQEVRVTKGESSKGTELYELHSTSASEVFEFIATPSRSAGWPTGWKEDTDEQINQYEPPIIYTQVSYPITLNELSKQFDITAMYLSEDNDGVSSSDLLFDTDYRCRVITHNDFGEFPSISATSVVLSEKNTHVSCWQTGDTCNSLFKEVIEVQGESSITLQHAPKHGLKVSWEYFTILEHHSQVISVGMPTPITLYVSFIAPDTLIFSQKIYGKLNVQYFVETTFYTVRASNPYTHVAFTDGDIIPPARRAIGVQFLFEVANPNDIYLDEHGKETSVELPPSKASLGLSFHEEHTYNIPEPVFYVTSMTYKLFTSSGLESDDGILVTMSNPDNDSTRTCSRKYKYGPYFHINFSPNYRIEEVTAKYGYTAPYFSDVPHYKEGTCTVTISNGRATMPLYCLGIGSVASDIGTRNVSIYMNGGFPATDGIGYPVGKLVLQEDKRSLIFVSQHSDFDIKVLETGPVTIKWYAKFKEIGISTSMFYCSLLANNSEYQELIYIKARPNGRTTWPMGWEDDTDGVAPVYTPKDVFTSVTVPFTLTTPKRVILVCKDYCTGEVIPGATVLFENETYIADSNGLVDLGFVETGEYPITVMKTGYLDSDEDYLENDVLKVS